MGRRIIREDEVNTPQEIATEFQKVTDNLVMLEAKIEQLLASIGKKDKKKKVKENDQSVMQKVKRKLSKKKVKKNEGNVTMKTLISLVITILLATVCFATVNIKEINHDTITSGTFDQDLRGWIDTLNTDIVNAGGSILANRGTGDVFYVDSATGSDTRVGTSLSTAVATIDAAVNLCSDNNGDVIYVVQGYAETIDNETTDAIDLDVAGITVVGLGYGTDAPELLYDTTTDELVFDANNVVLYNIRLLAGVSAVVNAIEVKDGADNCAIVRCVFPEPTTSSWEFVRGIVVVTADDLIIANCEQRTVDDTGATNFIDNDSGVTTGLKVVGNIAIGQYAEGILHSDDIDLENYIADNDFSNLTTGEHAIEFTAAATGTAKDNTMFSDTVATTFDPGSLKCFNNYTADRIDQSAVLVPGDFFGPEMFISMTATAQDDDLFDVDGGDIVITGFYGVIGTAIGATSSTMEIQINADRGATWDLDFSTAVDVASATTVIVFDNTKDESVLSFDTGYSFASSLNWFCPEGLIEQETSVSTNTGDIVWYMTYIPLSKDVIVTGQ